MRPNLRLLYAAIAGSFALVVGLPSAEGRGETRLWPLPIDANLTSSFCEYRGGHLHAGIDVKTYGREGVPCRAVDRGHISRLRASPQGYGKALYLTLHSGETAVYAHLAEFSPRLEAILLAKQIEADRYRVDVYFDADSLRVGRGDIIGYTGSTGTGAPHLHFEMRDAKQNPTNPLSGGFDLEDHERPVAQGVVWYPLTAQSTVAGLCQAFEQSLVGDGSKTFAPVDTVVLDGRFGLSAQIVDRINSSSGKLAPYSIDVALDGERIARIVMESFTYDHTREVELAYDMARVRLLDKHYLMLYQRTGETLWHREFTDRGIIDTARLSADVVHHIEVTAADRAGNTSVLRLPFRVGSVSVPTEQPGVGLLTGAYVFEDLISLRGSLLSDACRSRLDGVFPLAGLGGAYRALAADLPRGTIDLQFEDTPLPNAHLIVLRGGEPNVVDIPARGLQIRAGRSSIYGDALVWVAAEESMPGEGKTAAGLRPVGSALAMGPVGLTLRAPIELSWMSPGSNDERRALYVYDLRKDEWAFMPSTVVGDTVKTDVGGPGIFAVFVDEDPPVFGPVAVERRKSYATGATSVEVVIPIADPGCGLDDDLTEVYLNGNKQIARWDGFSEKMFVTLREQNIMGTQRLSVVAVDRVGNTARFEDGIVIKDAESKQN